LIRLDQTPVVIGWRPVLPEQRGTNGPELRSREKKKGGASAADQPDARHRAEELRIF